MLWKMNKVVKRAIGFGLLVGVVGVCAVAGRVFRDDGPVYEGRSLKQWVVKYEGNGGIAPTVDARARSAEVKRAQQAFTAAGTNAWPYLVKWMKYEGPSKFQMRAAGWLSRFPRLVALLDGRRAWEFSSAAAAALAHGGPALYGACRELETMVRDHRYPATAGQAVGVLTRWMDSMGDGRFEYAAGFIEDTDSSVRQIGVFGLCAGASDSRRERSERAVRLLAKHAAEDADAINRVIAVEGLGGCKSCGLIPFRVHGLAVATADPDVRVARSAVRSLAGFGANAVPGLPALTNCLGSSNGSIRLNAEDAIRRITADARPAMGPGSGRDLEGGF